MGELAANPFPFIVIICPAAAREGSTVIDVGSLGVDGDVVSSGTFSPTKFMTLVIIVFVVRPIAKLTRAKVSGSCVPPIDSSNHARTARRGAKRKEPTVLRT